MTKKKELAVQHLMDEAMMNFASHKKELADPEDMTYIPVCNVMTKATKWHDNMSRQFHMI
jgi:hypothetical protein